MIRFWLGQFTILAGAFFASLWLGDLPIRIGDVVGALVGSPDTPEVARVIVADLRLPRSVLAVLVGAALAVSGGVTQTLMSNPLAEPGILGINSGAALAAMIVIVRAEDIPESYLPWLAFAGALVMSGAVYGLAWRQGTTSLRIILIGIGLGSMVGAGATFIAAFGPVAEAQRAMVWMAGSLQDSRWIKVRWMLIWGVPAVAILWAMARELDLIGYGDAIARGLGQQVQAVRRVAILAVAMLAGAAVAAAGPLIFVGLVAPHIARRLVSTGHARLIPASALIGATLVVLADLAARRAMPPIQLPVGLATALLGAPFFGYLLWRRRNE